MPHIFHNPPTRLRIQTRLDQKPSCPQIMLFVSSSNAIPRHGELTTTCGADDLGHLFPREQGHEVIGEFHRRGMIGIVRSVAEIASGLELGGTADDPGAAEVDVACFLDIVELEVFDGDNRVWRGGIGEVSVSVYFSFICLCNERGAGEKRCMSGGV